MGAGHFLLEKAGAHLLQRPLGTNHSTRSRVGGVPFDELSNDPRDTAGKQFIKRVDKSVDFFLTDNERGFKPDNIAIVFRESHKHIVVLPEVACRQNRSGSLSVFRPPMIAPASAQKAWIG